jgi:hypothetical protein
VQCLAVITHTREKIKQSSAITIESKQTTPKFNDLNNYSVTMSRALAGKILGLTELTAGSRNHLRACHAYLVMMLVVTCGMHCQC